MVFPSQASFRWFSTEPVRNLPNGNNAAKNATAAFSQAGGYSLRVTISDGSQSIMSDPPAITVSQTLNSIGLSPAGPTLDNGQTQQFTATARDQFGNAMTTQPTFTWSVDADGDAADGTITSGGLYTAPAAGTGGDTVRAAGGGLAGTSTLAINSGTALFNLSANAVSSEQIDLAWSSVTGAEGYRIEASSDGILFDQSGTFDATDTTASAIGFDTAMTFSFRIVAFDATGDIGVSNIVAATTSSTTPITPSQLTAAEEVDGEVELNWWDQDSLEDGFTIERSTDGVTFTFLEEVSANTESYVDFVPDPSEIYYYRLQAFNNIGASGFSNVAISGSSSFQVLQQQVPPQQDILVSFYGADPGEVSSEGNLRFLRPLSDRLGGTLNPAEGQPYRDFQSFAALVDLLEAIDHDDNFRITQAEIDAVTVRMLAWSWGSIAAVNISRQLAPENGRIIGYRLDNDIPVESMVVIDPVHQSVPRLVRFTWGPVKNNVVNFTNYYERRDDLPSTIEFYLPTTDFEQGEETYAGFEFPGTTLPSQAQATNQIRVDTNPLYAIQEKRHDYTPRNQTAVFDGTLRGNEVNHTTIVWYVQEEAAALL